jgi:hypothetical protein
MATSKVRKLRETVIIDQLTLSIYDDETIRIETSGCCEISLRDLNAELAILGGLDPDIRSGGTSGHDARSVPDVAEVARN